MNDQNSVDWEYRYQLFVEKANKLRRAEYLKHLGKTGSIKYNLSWDAEDKIVRTATNLPDEGEKDSFEVTFRLFYMHGEPVSYNSIVSVLIRDAPQDVKEKLEKLKDSWNKTLNGNNDSMPFKLEEELVKPDEIIDLFLFSDLTHVNDREKVEKFKNINEGSLNLRFRN